jgi:hypothetical protein
MKIKNSSLCFEGKFNSRKRKASTLNYLFAFFLKANYHFFLNTLVNLNKIIMRIIMQF